MRVVPITQAFLTEAQAASAAYARSIVAKHGPAAGAIAEEAFAAAIGWVFEQRVRGTVLTPKKPACARTDYNNCACGFVGARPWDLELHMSGIPQSNAAKSTVPN